MMYRGLLCLSMIVAMSALGCVIDNNSASDSDRDGGASMLDGGIECNQECSSDGCPSGNVTMDENCRCVCEGSCEEIPCPAVACAEGEQSYLPQGECCSICIAQCTIDADCQAGDICNDEGLCAPDCDLCGACPEGQVAGLDPLECCACVPACGLDSPFACNEGERCENGRCIGANTCDEVLCEMCPVGTAPGATLDGECCPQCLPVDTCETVQCEACPPDTEYGDIPEGECCPTCVSACACPEIYAPVCGSDGQTYENSCLAACADVSIRSNGECRRECDCPLLYEPVCANGVTYPNSCLAECNNVRRYTEGECGDDPICDPSEGCQRACTVGLGCLTDVCGAIPREELRELTRECVQDCRRGEPDVADICAPTTCEELIDYLDEQSEDDFCTEIACSTPTPGVEYVGIGDECEVIDYACPPGEVAYSDNCGCGCFSQEGLCDAPPPVGTEYVGTVEECMTISYTCLPGYEAFTDECGCGCAFSCNCPIDEGPEVCTADGERYRSRCEAACAGVRNVLPCEEECVCNDVYRPVCAEDGTTYGNRCEARCANARIVSDGECPPTQDSICDDPRNATCEDVCGIIIDCTRTYCDPADVSVDQCVNACQDLGSNPVIGNVCRRANCEDVLTYVQSISETNLTCDFDQTDDCPDENAGAEYISEDPSDCALIGAFQCNEGSQPFSNECGCGCAPLECPIDGVNAAYVSTMTERCELVEIECPNGRQAFNNACGCGCLF